MEQPYMLPILHWQYHTCWCSGDFRSQSISRHGIESPTPTPTPCLEHQKSEASCCPIKYHDFNSLDPGRCGCNFKDVIFKFQSLISSAFPVILLPGECPQTSLMMNQRWLGNKPLLEPMLTKTFDVIWHHQATMSSCSVHAKKQWHLVCQLLNDTRIFSVTFYITNIVIYLNWNSEDFVDLLMMGMWGIYEHGSEIKLAVF